ncbi:hypothetical protein LguiA_030972 [Lonicera macranthoides]
MAIVTTQEASSWASRCAYDVFLSFRGEDTRTKFTDHLYTTLIGAGFRTFRDNEGIERGENIKLELQRVIQRSRISLVVLSENYASSGWCLDELVLIVECKRTMGHIVIPLFYDVDPSHVRKQNGVFAIAFAAHEEKLNSETDARKKEWMGKLEGWRAALREVADLGGMVLQNEADGHEAKFIQKVVKVVRDKLSRTALSVAPYLIGIEARVRKINMWLHDGSDGVGILAIYGMGGIGKTTIAKRLYNLNFERFEGSSFLANVREYSEQSDGLVRLQRQLLSDILRGRKEKIRNVDEGIIKIKNALCSKKVLLVIDDVDQRDQLDAILGMQDWFYPGSKIILTTRHERLLKAHEVYKVHEVQKLDDDDSLELFSWHAFGQDHPIDGFMDHSTRVVNYCGGLPLALQVLGSSLSGRSVDIWESAIQKLETIPDGQILKKLKISYDNLQDSHDKNLFLDISCFFVGEEKDNIITILDGCDFYTKVGVQNLIDRCLLTINQNKKVMMHQLLQEMGREIIRQESPQEPGRRSRLCRHKDCVKVLREKTGTEMLEGLSLCWFVPKEKNQAGTLMSSHNGKQDRSSSFNEGNSSKRRCLGVFSWLSTGLFSSQTESFSPSNDVDFETDSFSRMRKLRLLQLKRVRLIGDYKYFPRELRWLCWHGFSLKSIPDRFPLENLVCLDMKHSSLKQVWKGIQFLGLLKILDLSYSPLLELTPNFSGLANLERLSLRYCINLGEIHESIGELGRLLSLNLEGCNKLQKLPTGIGQLKSLEKLVLSGCSKLKDFPFDLGKMECLTVFHADGTSIFQSPTTTEEIKSSNSIFWPWISKPAKTPEPVKFAMSSLGRSLVNLSLANCNLPDDAIPKDLGCLLSLQNLNLSGNQIHSLPESIKNLTMLQALGLDGCKRLHSLPQLPSSITDLDLENCESLELVTNIPNMSSSLDLWIGNCSKLVEAHGLFKLGPIRDIDAEILNHLGLVDLESMGNIEGLCEFGIYSVYLPRSEVPAWFSYRTFESSLCCNVPSLPNAKIIGLNICTIYAHGKGGPKNPRNESWDECYIRISNDTKNLKWVYSPTFLGVPDDEAQDMTWLCHWKFGNQLEGGDEVNISVFLRNVMQLKELGVHVVYETEEAHCFQNDAGGADLSAYEVRTGSYFLCHYEYDLVQTCSLDDGWTTFGWYDFLFEDIIPSKRLLKFKGQESPEFPDSDSDSL